jgi:hypothetical protein
MVGLVLLWCLSKSDKVGVNGKNTQVHFYSVLSMVNLARPLDDLRDQGDHICILNRCN